MQFADAILIMGSNMAECHPVGFQWVLEAKLKGAKVIHVDPRFTRTSANANLHLPLRAGSDIAFLGGIIRYILDNERYFKEYVLAYTNAAALLKEEFRDTEDLDGLFSGWDAEKNSYDTSSWQYQGTAGSAAQGSSEPSQGDPHQTGAHGASDTTTAPPEDRTLQDPRCVLQVLRRHFARYTPEMVEQVCGVSKEKFLEVAETLCANSGRERTSAIVYSVGWTQHTTGVQNIRTAAIIQLLLGNMGRPGGGILALRGHASIQGCTDIPTLYNILPGYLPMPDARKHRTVKDFIQEDTAPGGYWGYMPNYMVSLLKAYYRDSATRENDWCFDLLPRIDGDHSTYKSTLGMLDGTVRGFFVIGENPAVGSANGKLHRMAMSKLDWMVVRDFVEVETASFWKQGPEVLSGELKPEEIGTEVFFMPAATHVEKEGTFTNTQRLLQWRHKAVEPPGDARSELWFYYHLGRIIRDKLADSTQAIDRGIQRLHWSYPLHGPRGDEPVAESVLREINGFDSNDRALTGFMELKSDGSTVCGCWIYCGVFAGDDNKAARRKPHWEQSWVAPEWGWAWPANRRILYNRASADPEGRPWSDRKKYVWWDVDKQRWTGEDVPDFKVDMAPDYRPGPGARAEMANGGDKPFIMQTDGRGWLYAPTGLLDGPMPAHYEPHESPFDNPLYEVQSNPARQQAERPLNQYNTDRRKYPFVFTTYRLTEHHTAGGMSRFLPYLSELQPEMFCEVHPELARERGLTAGGWAVISTARSAIEARVLVTERVKPLRMKGRSVHQVGLPYHWGSVGLARGGAANDLLSIVMDPNVHIQEAKAATCDIRPGRLGGGAAGH